MHETDRRDVTRLLDRANAGDASALPELLAAAYAELRAVAANIFQNQRHDHTLQPTALVNEVCVRLLGPGQRRWNDHRHFVRAAAKAMRNLLTDHARAKRAEIRGGGHATVTLDEAQLDGPLGGPSSGRSGGIDPVVLDETITRLAAMDERLGLVFELRFLAGLPVSAAAEVAGVSERTIELDSQFIRAWLQRELAS
ncbi:MAG: hypothetical protein GIKADHBN_00564 [Phycisphaerales bacterium]|nr:hypothetical protein [Phycisphaerales bacterium]